MNSIFRPPKLTHLLYDSPHSGRSYPADWKTLATRDQLRLGEDAYVDELLKSSVKLGATLLVENTPRCYIDVNREESDLDPEMLDADWPEGREPTDKSRRGLGLIRRYVIPGVAINSRKLSYGETYYRIETVYRPYHHALGHLVKEILESKDRVWLVDWHSMKSKGNAMTPDGEGALRPDFVVSDNYGATSAAELVDLVVSTLRGSGYSVSINDPYAGGTIVKRWGHPVIGLHSVQVEINRALYLDEAKVEKKPESARLVADIESLTQILAGA